MNTYDQFDIDPVGAFSGSMRSDVLQPKGSIFFSGPFERCVLGNSAIRKVETSTLFSRVFLHSDLPNLYVPDLVLGTTKTKWFSGAGFQRNNTLICEEEQYSDSVIGYPLDYSKVNGLKNFLVTLAPIGYFDPAITNYYGFIDAEPSSSITLFLGSTGTIFNNSEAPGNFCDTTWNYTAPYQSRYKGVTKTKDRLTRTAAVSSSFNVWNYGQTIGVTGLAAKYGAISNIAFIDNPGTEEDNIPGKTIFFADRVLYFSSSSTASLTVPPPKSGGVSPNLTSKLLYNCFFGFGDNPGNSPNHTDLFKIASYLSVSFVPTIRGYKYGLISAMPKYTTAVYRSNHFGHPRDLMEQRPFTKFYDERGNFQGAVTVNFKSGTQAYVLAKDYLTATNPSYNPRDSGIYDYEYKSGYGFTDSDSIG